MQRTGLRECREDGKLEERRYPVVDLHTHILPQMDDGSRSVEMSLELLRNLRKQGATVVCCTSHYYAMQESIDRYVERRKAAFNALFPKMDRSMPSLVLGAEVAWFRNMSRYDLKPLCLGEGRTLLLEMPFSDWSQQVVEEVISLVLDRDYRIILVHPERFCFSKGNRRYLERLAELPIAFQVNADTFLDWRTRKQGLSLLETTRFPLLGSDTHNLTSRAPHLGKAREIIEKKLGKEFLQRIEINSVRAITGQEWKE